MKNRKEQFKNKLALSFGIVFIISIAFYFIFRTEFPWVVLTLPEFMGVSFLGLIVTLALKKNTPMKFFYWFLITFIALGIVGFIYGVQQGIRFLIDLTPELIGSTTIGLIFTIIFKKKVFMN